MYTASECSVMMFPFVCAFVDHAIGYVRDYPIFKTVPTIRYLPICLMSSATKKEDNREERIVEGVFFCMNEAMEIHWVCPCVC